MIKHSTATVYVLHRFDDGQWRLALIEHPLWRKWVPAGGHVEPTENAAEAALREAAEETGLTNLRLIEPHSELPRDYPPVPHDDVVARVPVPWWIMEFALPSGDRHLSEPHIHVDHQFVAIAEDLSRNDAEDHPFGWYTADELAELHAFQDVLVTGRHLLERVSQQVSGRTHGVSTGVE